MIEPRDKPAKPLLFFILFMTMFLVGFIESIKGVSYPLIKTEFEVPYEKQGVMVSFLSFCFVLSCFLSGLLLGKFGIRKVYTSGFICLITGLFFIFFMPSYLSIVAALILITAGFGIFEVSSNALASRLFTSRAALLMSIFNFFYGVGSSLSPRAAGAVSAALNWRYAYLFSIPLLAALFIPYLKTRFHDEPRHAEGLSEGQQGHQQQENQQQENQLKKAGFFTAFKTPMVWHFSITLGFMVGVEVSSVNWAGLYFQDVYGLDPKTSGAAFISFFYILFTVSRLLSGFVIEKAGYLRSLFAASAVTIIILSFGFSLGAGGIRVLPVLGFFTALFWPTILATAMGYFQEDAPIMTSAMIVISGAMNSLIQLLMGFTNRLIGPAWGYRSALFYAGLVFASLVILRRRIKKPYRTGG